MADDLGDTAAEDSSECRLTSRRAMLSGAAVTGAGAAAFAAGLGFPVPFLENLPLGTSLLAWGQEGASEASAKPGLTSLGERPLVLETPPHLLDDDITPASRFFVRNNGQTPAFTPAELRDWRLRVDGEVQRPLDLSIADLKRDFEPVTLRLVMECAGNGRRFFRPATPGNQWTFGGVGCAEWTGVRLRDVLQRAGLRSTAVYTGHYGADPHLTGDPARQSISRGLPIAKAIEPHTLIAWAMNGADMPVLNGHPLRLIAPGWPGSCSQKWLTRIWVRDRVHDGEKMEGDSYKMPAYPIAPGAEIAEEDLNIIESMPVKSMITSPRTGARVRAGRDLDIRGHAWAGESDIAHVDVSLDFGATWTRAELGAAPNKYAWRRFRTRVRPPEQGYYEVWARATDSEGRSQPPVAPGWNPKGYNNNQQHRIAVFVA